jgi:hypothetical protein
LLSVWYVENCIASCISPRIFRTTPPPSNQGVKQEKESPSFTNPEKLEAGKKKNGFYIALGILAVIVIGSMFMGTNDPAPTNSVVATPKTTSPKNTPAPVTVTDSYHSVYVDRQTWGWGAASSAGNANQADADQRAKNECEKINGFTGRCAKYSWGNATCYAVFYIPDRQQDRIVLKLGNTKEEALTKGKSECEQQSGSTCELTGNVSCS